MAKKYTKKGRKSRSAGRFGARYGRKIRKLVADVEEQMRAPYNCPSCNKQFVSRVGTGIWKCSKCGLIFTGGAYVPTTPVGESVFKAIKRSQDE
ncbi:50S ribosomal protein L37ae [Methanosarcinales archaeon]|uniref:Large ribosomal subunit protein eL43 n=1 Tax=Candidatus Syntropharchaeum caldarium TaxID=1838285 RepID=A0A1F2P935_9EURY|nr:MAG: Ribosomal protein L37ae [Candidatus Syntrophoarchaeum caldarius]RLG32343.1 MAG: 50S ribosomal protein L37ae [Methanosarcinales archaeon]